MFDTPLESNVCILIVDDNPANLRLLFLTLEQGGYTNVIPAESAEDALLRLQHSTPDLILLDIKMPEVSGFELYQKIREDQSTVDTPIIFISALADRESIEKGFKLGAVDYIIKPFQTAEILGRVATHIRIKSLQQSLLSSNDQLSTLLSRHQSILNSVGEGVFGLNADLQITFINPYALKQIGYLEEEILGKSVLNLVVPTRQRGSALNFDKHPILNSFRKSETCFIEEGLFFPKNEEVFPVEYTVSSLQGDFKKNEVVVLFRNISDRKQAEHKKEKLITQLKEALSKVKLLSGFIPICASCKKIRDDKGYWEQVELYVSKHSEAVFSHGICPACEQNLYGDEEWYKKLKLKNTEE